MLSCKGSCSGEMDQKMANVAYRPATDGSMGGPTTLISCWLDFNLCIYETQERGEREKVGS